MHSHMNVKFLYYILPYFIICHLRGSNKAGGTDNCLHQPVVYDGDDVHWFDKDLTTMK